MRSAPSRGCRRTPQAQADGQVLGGQVSLSGGAGEGHACCLFGCSVRTGWLNQMFGHILTWSVD